MASMNRNVNLEEINTDAFMGISYLNYQSIPQKIVFIGGVLVGIALNLIGTFILDISINVSILLNLVPLLVGVVFGCNYNEDLSLIKYMKLLISKPSKVYYSKPVEDLEQLHKAATRIREEEEQLKKQQEKISDEAQKKMLIKLGIGSLIVIVIFIVLLITIKATNKKELHHTVQESYYSEVGGKNI